MKRTAYRMTPDVIRKIVVKNRPGVYMLGNVVGKRFVPGYVGRSDFCLRTRLLNHNYLYKFPYFLFCYAEDPKESFILESKWWHDCKNHKIILLNAIHPASPANLNLRCPYCQFLHEMELTFPAELAS